jgi:hypothetical protein
MINWFDLMRQAQGGAGLDNMARQFGLSPEQAQLAVGALMPAFAMGLQRNLMDPHAMMQFFQLMNAGSYPNFFDSAAQAFSIQGRREGQAIVDKLFGSDEVTRRVAQQAAQFSGVGTEVLNQILPLAAAILAGGMFKIMKGQGAMLGSMAQAWRDAAPEASAPPKESGNPWIDLWAAWMNGFSGGSAPDKAGREAPPQERSFDDAMAGFLGTASRPETEKTGPQPQPDPMEAWGEMMEKGQEMQRQHLETLQAIFDSAWKRDPAKP